MSESELQFWRTEEHCALWVQEVFPQEATTASLWTQMTLRHPFLQMVQAGRCGTKEEGEREKARVLRFTLHLLIFSNYGYSKMEKVKDCLLLSLHKSTLTPSVNGTILGGK